MAARCALIMVLLFLGAVPCAAQVGIGLGPVAGLYKGRDADGYRVMGGAVLRIRFSELVGVEGSVYYREESFNHGSVEVRSWPFMVTTLLYPVPFVYGAIGAGLYDISVSYGDSPGIAGGPAALSVGTRQQFGWHCGGGVELTLFSSVTLIGDIRYVMMNSDFRSVPGSNGVISSSPILTAGFLFGL